MSCVDCGRSPTVMGKGVASNRAAYLAARSITLREQVLEWDKQARKTPAKTLHKEWEKVCQAKIMAEAAL